MDRVVYNWIKIIVSNPNSKKRFAKKTAALNPKFKLEYYIYGAVELVFSRRTITESIDI